MEEKSARFLWLTLCNPYPQTNGQFLYSGGLIRAVGRTGARITVLGLSREAGDQQAPREDHVEWRLAADEPSHRLRRLFSRFPSSALRTRVPEMRTMLDDQLRSTDWDALILDSINVGWALPQLIRYRRRRPQTRIAYLAQNNEAEVARHVAQADEGWRKGVRLLQVAKTKRLERQLARSVNLVTADAPEDCSYLSRLAGGQPVVFVPPGYEGRRIKERTIGPGVPRRAIIVGSFDFPPKRTSLQAFLVEAATLFEKRGIELQVIGRTDPSYVSALRNLFPTVQFLGSVPEIASHMASARIGLVPDLLGSFKLKSLDYAFNRLPIFAIAGAVPGLGLRNREGLYLAKSHSELAEAAADAMDDFGLLNRLQEAAFRQCDTRFDWNTVGPHLKNAISDGRITGSPLVQYSAAHSISLSRC